MVWIVVNCAGSRCWNPFVDATMMVRLVDRQLALAERSAPWAAPYRVLRTTQVLDRKANLGSADMGSTGFRWRHGMPQNVIRYGLPGYHGDAADGLASMLGFFPHARWGSLDFIRAAPPPPPPRPHRRAPDLCGHCRTSSARSYWTLPDLNRERQMSDRMPQRMPDRMSVYTSDRAPDRIRMNIIYIYICIYIYIHMYISGKR